MGLLTLDQLCAGMTLAADVKFATAHSLKGISGNLGAMSMTAIADKLQTQGHEGPADVVRKLTDDIETEFQRVRQDLETDYLTVEKVR